MNDRSHLKQVGVASCSKVEPGLVVAVIDAHSVIHGMFDVLICDAVLPSRWMNLKHNIVIRKLGSLWAYATSLTSKLGIASSLAPPSRARIRLT